MSDILTGFNIQGNDPIDDRIVSKSNLETLEQYLKRVPVQKRYYGLTFFALDKNNELRKYTFQTSLINPTIDDYKELQEHVSDKAIHKTSEEIRSEIVDADIPDTIARVQWTLDQINTAVINLIGGASDEYNTLKRIQTKIEELRAKIYGDDGSTVLNTLEQALKFLNQYKDFIVDIPENFVNKQDIVDNLTTDDPTKVLSAKQGKVLSDTLTNYFESAMQSIRTETDRAINAENRIETKLDKEIDRSIKEDQRIDAKLDAEIKRSTDEDLRIDSKLASEINRSTTEDDRLDKKIDTETTRATEAESNLNTKIETETDRAEGEESRIEAKLDNEITRSTNKDTEHDNRLQALEGDTHEQNTDLGTTNSTFQLKYNTGNKIKHESDAISVRNAADTDYVNFIAKNATFKGDLLVEGQSFVTEAETVEIKDNLLLLNKGEVGAGVTKGIAGLEIDRGTEPNYFIIFDESDNRFKAGVEGDLWNLALRESDDNMLDGYFISWNSKDKILSTTNIVNESTPLLFGRTDYKQYSGNRTDPDGNYSSYAFISEAEGNHLYNFSGSSNWNIDTDKINFRFWKPLLGTTFKRASDNSEVLYHADIVNNLTSGGTNKVLSAEQGKLLQNSITSIQGSYLPLSGGTMTGSIIFPNRKGIFGTLTNGTSNIKIAVVNANNNVEIGNSNTPLMLVSNSTDLTHYRDNNTYEIWDKFNLSDPATSTDLNNYLPLAGGTLTGQVTIQQNVDIKLRLQSTDADNYCIIQAINSQASQLGVFGYAGDKWAIGHNGTYYEIWDKYNLSNPVTYTTNTYNHATLTNKDGQYFTYIKAGTNGLLPHSKATLTSGGSGSLGTSDQSFNAAYINNLHTNKVTFGDAGSFIDNQSGDSDHIGIGFYTSQNAACPVYVGSLCVSDGYANSAPNIPTNGIYSKGVIKSAAGFTSNFRQTNLNLAKTGNDVLYISSFTVDAAGSPGTDSNTGKSVNDGMFLTYFWVNDNAFQLAADIDGTGIAYRQYIPSSGNSTTGWKFLADTNWVVSKINSSTSNFLKKTGDTATGQIILDSNGIAFKANIWTNDLTPNKNYSGYLQVLDAYDAASAGGPTNHGTVLQINSRNSHWANQLWFPGGAEASKKGLYYRHMPYNSTTYGEWIKLATTSDLGNYLPLSGGTLSGNLTINTVGSTTFVINNNDTNGSETFMRVLRKGTASAAIGFRDSLGAYIYNYNSNKYLFIDNDGYARVGTTSGSTRLALITDIPTVSGYLPLSGGTMTGALTMNSRKNNAVIDVVGGTGNNWNGGAGALSVQVPGDGGQTPLLVARRSGAAIDTTTAAERLLSMELLNTGNTFRITLSNTSTFQLDLSTAKGFLFGKTIATTDQIPSIPSISISNSGTGNAVTSITANGHTLNVTKGATYLTSHQTIYNLTFQAGTFAAKTFDPNGAAATVNIPTNTSHLTNDSGFITSSALNGYATQSWANGQFAPLKNYFVTGNYASIATTGNEMCIGSLTSENSIIYINYRNGTGTTSPSSWYWRAGSSTSWANAYWGNLYMNKNLVATQTWASRQFPTKTGTGASGTWGISITGNAATATNASQLGGTAAASYVKANDNISRLTNDSGYTTQEWVNGQGFLTSDSLLDKFVPTTGGYIRNSDQVLLRLQRTGVSTGTSRTIEMYFDDSNTDGTSTTPRGSIGYNSEVGMFLYSAASKKFLAMEYTGRPFYGTPENRYYLLGSNTQYHNLDGYQRIGDIMIQWGYFTVQGNSTRAVNFPVSFTNTVWSVTGSWDNTTTGSQENWGFTDYTSSGFTIINGDGSSRVFHYIAIGPFTRS